MSRQIAAGEAIANVAPGSTPEHDSLTWLVPIGHLDGPNKASTHYLRTVIRQSIDKTASLLHFTTPALLGQVVAVKRSLKNRLRRMWNRRRNLVRWMAYRTLSIFVDSTVNETTVEHFTIEQGSKGSTTTSQGHRLLVYVDGRRMKRVLDAKSAAADLIAEFFSLYS